MKTVTYDDTQWAIIPKQLTPEWESRLAGDSGVAVPVSMIGAFIAELISTAPQPHAAPAPFQQAVLQWVHVCFGPEIAVDHRDRNQRLVEETLELAQACGASRSECHQLVDYVFSRPVGEARQEVGGVMLTLAALCGAHDIDMQEAATEELVRVWEFSDKIRLKQTAKPKYPTVEEGVAR